jgi:TP901 family phage tail tape measure protein
MADRNIIVTLQAHVQDYLNGMDRVRAATARAHAVTDAAGRAFLAVGATAAAGLALAVKASSEFGAKMAQLQSLSHASAGEMKQLSDAAMTVGTAYGFSATQVADAEIELTKAGIGVKEQLGGALKGALTLAAAGQLDVAQATEITTVAMTQFGLKAAEVPHVADLLAAGADKALGSVGDLGEALKNGGLQAHNMGLTIDDTVGLLSAFANAGILGAEAGTQMRSMFIQLQKPTRQSQDVLDKYGIALNDASGKFVGITKLGEELRQKLGGLTQAQRNQALATIFGSHAITGATVLYNDSGKAAEKAGLSIGDWIKNVNDSGFASAQAAGKMNSLQGDVQKLAAAFQTDLIKAGTAADGSLRGVVQSVTGVVKAFGDLPGPMQGSIVLATTLIAGIGLLGGAVLLAIPKIVAFKTTLDVLGVSGGRFARLFGAGGIVFAGVTDIIGAFGALGEIGTATAQQVELAGTRIRASWSGVDKLFGSAGSSLTSGKGLKAALNELGDAGAFSASGSTKIFDALTFHITHLSDVYKANEGTFDAMGQQLAGLAKQDYGQAARSFSSLVSKFHLGADETKNLLRVMPAYREELVAIADKNHIAATDTNLLALAQGKGGVSAKALAGAQRDAAAASAKNEQALGALQGQADTTTTSLDKLEQAIEGFGSAQLDARSAARKLEAAFDDAITAIKKNGHNLDITTQKGRDNSDALDNIATAATNAAAKYLHLNHDAAGAAKVLADGRAKFIDAAEAAGMGAKAAGKLADQLGLIPKNISTAVHVTGATGVGGTLHNLSAAGKAFAKAYEARLLADGHDATEAHKTAMAEAAKWEKQHPTATVDADPRKAKQSIAQATADAHKWDAQHPTATIDGNNKPTKAAIAVAMAAAADWDRQHPTATIAARDDASAKIRAIVAKMNNLNGTRATIYVNAVASGVSTGRAGQIAKNALLRAAGGEVPGPGPKGVDSVPALLAPGEHVLTARDVDLLGGQAAVYRLRQALQAGMVPRYAAGGAVPRISSSSSAAPVVEVVMPDTITVRDMKGLEFQMAVVADHTYARRDHAKAVSGRPR